MLSPERKPHKLFVRKPRQRPPSKLELRSIERQDQALLAACRADSVEACRIALLDGANTNCTDEFGATPLHVAHNVEIVNLLLAAHAILRPRDWMGDTPLHYAARTGNQNVARCLLERGHPVDIRNRDGSCPMHTATLHGQLPLLQLLIAADDHDAVDKLDGDGNTALHLACYRNDVPIIDFLLSLRAKVNFKNNDDTGPLHWAAYFGHVATVTLLLAHDADPTLVDGDDQQPKDLAERNGHTDVVAIFVGANPN